ncbi:TonB-dependent receptor [Duganella sp. FT80W]|uniref:TonB-dependent receptor n=1 Tax=Duganella guangzhouensis TaxID=2666084 RepID=A0A6I2KV23_9BURK|nr:TonB-dependent receptor [Duganella guangzhouensis]MRW89768.1 TonB-dependent receptor [Duganella guangzhouensis]
MLHTTPYKQKAIVAAISAILAGTSAIAGAQTTAPQDTPTDAATEAKPIAVDNVVTVTGTSIRGIAPVGAGLTKMTMADIAATGATTGTEMLRALPQLNNFNTTGNNTGSNQANFVDQPAVHGIGVGNGGGGLTLLLLDGHRLPGAGINQTAPDAGGIPLSALQRVEVMADGGSSIYGSDAIAGVVNFVTRRNFNGAETGFNTGSGSGYRSTNFSQVFGKTWEDGGWLLSYEHTHNTALAGTERSYIVNDQRPYGGSDSRSTLCSPANITMGGVAYTLNASGAITPGTSKCEANRASDLYPAQTRDSVFSSLRQNVSDRVELYGSVLASQRDVKTHVAGDGVTSGSTTVSVPSSSPYYRAINGSTDTQSVTYNPAGDFGSTFTNNIRTQTLSLVAGANVELSGGWNAKVEFNYGLERDDVRNHGIDQALATTSAANGTFNPYGVGAATDAALLARIGNYETRYFARQTLKEGQAKLDGSIFKIPGGDVKLAVGVDVRQEGFDGLVVTGQRDAGTPYSAGGTRTSKSAFGELFLPLVGKANRVSGVEKLDLSLAARYDNYSDVGNTTNPKAGVTWTVVEGAQIRASAGRSFHAPSLADAGTAIDTRAIRFPCISGAYVGCSSAGSSDYTVVLAGGNSNLKPETAQTYNVGFDLSPSLLKGFKLSMSYFAINYNDVITFPTFGPVVNPLAAYDKYRIVRSAGMTDAEWLAVIQPLLAGMRHDGLVYPDVGGLPTAVYDLRRQNFADERIRGIDFDIGYGFRTELGKWNLNLAGTRMLKFDQIVPGVADKIELLGTNYAIKTKARGQLGWSSGAVAASLFLNYTGGYRNSVSTGVQQVSSFTTVDTNWAWTLPNTDGWLKGTRLTFNISNIFNRDTPVYYTSGTNGIVGFDASSASALGRVVSVGLNKDW